MVDVAIGGVVDLALGGQKAPSYSRDHIHTHCCHYCHYCHDHDHENEHGHVYIPPHIHVTALTLTTPLRRPGRHVVRGWFEAPPADTPTTTFIDDRCACTVGCVDLIPPACPFHSHSSRTSLISHLTSHIHIHIG
ncbi:unnamed protein product [Taenia asiatica]|uniref:Secreted protein n=1 Tax=Taenia asiatica TaxID=60517 RepID=A0A0R3WHA1_TAEAS|nr:unnamed protein product [Taenia asiatica]